MPDHTSTATDGRPPGDTGISSFDLPTLDKIPVIKRLMGSIGEGLALDIGIGTGYTTYQVFGDNPTVCLDLVPENLGYFRQQLESAGLAPPLSVIALAAPLPFADESFRYVLCSEVLEHLEDDDAAVAEIARVLRPDGTAVITVPYTGIGFTSFLERFGIKTVHDYPGPEFHVRPGYDEKTLARLLERHGLELAEHDFYLRFFTRILVDSVSLGHIAYQRICYGRKAWTWSEAAEVESSFTFRVFKLVFPMFRTLGRVDTLIRGTRGFGLVAKVRKPASPSASVTS